MSHQVKVLGLVLQILVTSMSLFQDSYWPTIIHIVIMMITPIIMCISLPITTLGIYIIIV